MLLFALALSFAAADGWTTKRELDPMTDEMKVSAEAVAGRVTLTVSCVRGKPAVALGVPEVVGRGHSRTSAPAYRVDNKPAATRAWSHLDRGGYLYADEAMQFVHDVTGGAVLRTRIITWDSQTIDTEFSLSGAEEAISNALRECT